MSASISLLGHPFARSAELQRATVDEKVLFGFHFTASIKDMVVPAELEAATSRL